MLTRYLVLAALAVGVVAAGPPPRRAAAPASRPSTGPASQPTMSDLLFSDDDQVGYKLVGATYDPATGMLKVRMAFGNKANKRVTQHSGILVVFVGQKGKHEGGAEIHRDTHFVGAIGVGQVKIVEWDTARLPSESDKQIQDAKDAAGRVDVAWLTPQTRFEGVR